MRNIKTFKPYLCLFLVLLFSLNVTAQSDSLIFTNGNYIIGEIKGMDRGIITVETDYSDNDFKIEWGGIKEIYSVTYFLITLNDGQRYNGKIESDRQGIINIITDDQGSVQVNTDDIVFLDSVDKGFWSQFYASIDIGFDMAKANNFRQLSVRSNLGYLAKRWSLNAIFNTLFSEQDDIESINREDGELTFKYYLPKDWYTVTSITFLSSTEQKIELRTTGNLGMGKFVIHTNRTYWGINAGASFNNENFSDDSGDRKSWEGFLGTELNMFDIGDFNLMTNLVAYPSITESGRWRADFNLDTKYDLPMDFYIKASITVNYDNRPVSGAPETDYVLYTGFGWEW